MPLDLDALLEPIPGADPCGSDIRYHPSTDKIKEARRLEDGAVQGVWKRDVKTADYTLVLKLGREALVKLSKDLQIAGWVTEAALHKEGFAGLRQGLELLRRLIDTYWDGVYPRQDEDGDLELRATPLSWVGSQLDSALREVPLLKNGQNWYHYRDSKSIPSEEDARSDTAKQQAREEAIQEGGMPPEEFENGFQATSAQDLRQTHDELMVLIDSVKSLGEFCDEKFGDASPDFNSMVRSLEEVYQVVRVLYKRKGGGVLDSAPEAEEEQEQATEPQSESNDWSMESYTAATPAAPAKRRAGPTAGPTPTSADDATARILSAARYLRQEQPFNPAGYLVSRALRWGELRAAGSYPDMALLEAPTTEIRVELKRLSREGEWEQLRQAAENAAGEPCGRGWLDLQRYAVTACRATGIDMVAEAILSGVRSLIADYPELPNWTLTDDTPTANPDTQQWLKDERLLPSEAIVQDPAGISDWNTAPPAPAAFIDPSANGEPTPPDSYDLAMEAARSGRSAEAVEILSREIEQEHSGRGRFLRKTQLAQVCLAVGNAALARPILGDLAEEIARRKLEDWEAPDLVSHPLALLYRCMDGDDDHKKELYARICRLDPRRALGLAG